MVRLDRKMNPRVSSPLRGTRLIGQYNLHRRQRHEALHLPQHAVGEAHLHALPSPSPQDYVPYPHYLRHVIDNTVTYALSDGSGVGPLEALPRYD